MIGSINLDVCFSIPDHACERPLDTGADDCLGHTSDPEAITLTVKFQGTAVIEIEVFVTSPTLPWIFRPVLRTGSQECVPVIRRSATLQHFLEHCIGIALAARGAQGVFVIHPGEDDDLGL